MCFTRGVLTLRQWKNSEHVNLRTWQTCGSYKGSLGIIATMWKTFHGSPTSYKSVLSVLNRTCLTQANKTKTIKNIQVSFKTPVMWEEKHRQALNVLASHPILATTDFSQPFILHIFASEGGLGSVFYQKDEGYRVRITNINQIPSAFWKN